MLYSRLIRSRSVCERCGDNDGPFDAAHIVRRRYSATRCHPDNAWCLCRSCHRLVDEDAYEFMQLVEKTIGVERYQELRKLAHAGTGMSSKAFWRRERERLMDACREAGVDVRWKPKQPRQTPQ